MPRATFVVESKAMALINEIKIRDRVSGAEVLRRALMLYHFIKEFMYKNRLPPGSTVEIRIGGKVISFDMS